jgi:hypothetical protein
MTNPFEAASCLANERGIFGEARLIRSGFLYRVIELESPYATRMVYSGWWFRQKIEFDGQLVWFRISWLSILKQAEFRMPALVDPQESPARVELSFGRRLMIRRFRLWIDGQIAYDEVNG